MVQALATASPQGDSIAYVAETFLYLHCLRTARTQQISLDRKLQANTVKSLAWSASGDAIVVLRNDSLAIINVGPKLKIAATLDNGSGGFGCFVTALCLDERQVLVIWEFGKAQIWNITDGTHVNLSDAKCVAQGQAAQLRPFTTGSGSTSLLSMLSRTGADDAIVMYLPSISQLKPSIKLPTLDAQSMSWSPDGRWLAIMDTPLSSSNLHILTPEGHVLRSLPISADPTEGGLGLKSVTWSPDGKFLALAKHEGQLELLNTRTFSAVATFQHTTAIDQSDILEGDRAIIWQETVSASDVRSYSEASSTVSPPLSTTKPSVEPDELGVVETRYNCDGTYLATRDSRTLTTVWIWNVTRLRLESALIMHHNVRKLAWQPDGAGILLVDCADGVAQVLDIFNGQPPLAISTTCKPKAALSWLRQPASAQSIILVVEKLAYKLLSSDGTGAPGVGGSSGGQRAVDFLSADDGEEDSLLDVLSGKKPLPPKTEPSFTERIDMAIEADDGSFSGQLDDTFREKIKAKHDETDPLDDSDIF